MGCRVQGPDESKRTVFGESALYLVDLLGWKGFGVFLPDLVRSMDSSKIIEVVTVQMGVVNEDEKDLCLARTALHILEYVSSPLLQQAGDMIHDMYCRCDSQIGEQPPRPRSLRTLVEWFTKVRW